MLALSAYALLAAMAAVVSFDAVFLRRSSSSWISFMVFLVAVGFVVVVHTGGVVGVAAGLDAAPDSLGREI